ncbi:MAG: Rab family GTPase [Candidatus Hodarchaeota archaeon]
MSKKYHRVILKTVLMGDGAVGKTALRQRYLGKGFKSTYMSTVGADFAVKRQKVNYKGEREIEFQIWDLAGQPRFQAVRGLYYKGCKAGLLCFDITRRDSMENLHGWFSEVSKHGSQEEIPLIVVANKLDLRSEVSDAIGFEEGAAFAEEIQKKMKIAPVKYIETSAKTGDNVLEAFETLAQLNLQFIEQKTGSFD